MTNINWRKPTIGLAVMALLALLMAFMPSAQAAAPPPPPQKIDCINKTSKPSAYPVKIDLPDAPREKLREPTWVKVYVKVHYKRCDIRYGSNYAKPTGVTFSSDFNYGPMTCSKSYPKWGHRQTNLTLRFRASNRSYTTSTFGLACDDDTTASRYVKFGDRNSKALVYGPKKRVPTWHADIQVDYATGYDAHGATVGRLVW